MAGFGRKFVWKPSGGIATCVLKLMLQEVRRIAQVTAAQIGAPKAGVVKVRPLEVGFAQIALPKIGGPEIRAAKIRPLYAGRR